MIQVHPVSSIMFNSKFPKEKKEIISLFGSSERHQRFSRNSSWYPLLLPSLSTRSLQSRLRHCPREVRSHRDLPLHAKSPPRKSSLGISAQNVTVNCR